MKAISDAQLAQRRQARRSHGLRAIEMRGEAALPADTPTIRALATLDDVAAEVETLQHTALWVAESLAHDWPGERAALPHSEAGRAMSLYADIAGRALAASVEIAAEGVKPLAGALAPDVYAEKVKESGEIATLQFQMCAIGQAWLKENGVYVPDADLPGRLQPLLRQHFGEYLERARRQATRHAALLAMGGNGGGHEAERARILSVVNVGEKSNESG